MFVLSMKEKGSYIEIKFNFNSIKDLALFMEDAFKANSKLDFNVALEEENEEF